MAQLKVPAHAGARERVNPEPRTAEPRWPAVLAILAAGGLHFAIPDPLRFGQEWLLLAVVSVLLVPTVVAHRLGKNLLNRVLGHIVLSAVTASMVWSLAMLIIRLPRHVDPPVELLRAAAAVWTLEVRSPATPSPSIKKAHFCFRRW
jgi:hypothetical protein